MADGFRIIIKGPPYPEPRYYGSLQWDERNVYIRHPGGRKDSRHSDGATWLGTTGPYRTVEMRVPTSQIGRELVNFVSLKPPQSEPPPLRGPIRATDLVVQTQSAGTMPRIAIEIVANVRVAGVCAAWERNSTVSSVFTLANKGLNQTLVVALAGSRAEAPSTSSR